jgi:omega-6 fatty acid desaturase (delta-12 desaturase)
MTTSTTTTKTDTPVRDDSVPTGDGRDTRQHDASKDVRTWARVLAAYREPNSGRGIFELGVTLIPFVALWLLTWLGVSFGYRASLLLVIPAAGFLVRLFMIQHDCGHGAFFPHRLANEWVGRCIGILTLTPFSYWRRTHAIHHATAGNLARRGIGDIETLTVREYLALSRWGRLKYRAYRNPLVMFGLGPIYLFLLQHRVPAGLMRTGWQPWLSTMSTNLVIAAAVAATIALIGAQSFLVVHLPIVLLAGSAGVWLFYVQHQFEGTVWAEEGAWNMQDAALYGSSHYDLPGVLRWFTANIGVHHVHHLCSRIPFYRLRRVLKQHPELGDVGRLTLWQSFRCVRLSLWDETRRKLVSFADVR